MPEFIKGQGWWLSLRGICFAVIAVCFLSSPSCVKKPEGLFGDPDIKFIFTKEEIEDLTIILDFFENEICDVQQVTSTNVEACYHALFENMLKSETTGTLYVPVPFHKQLGMYKTLTDGAFTDIWKRGTAVNQETGDTTIRMNLSLDGKYMQFLDSLNADYQILDAYKNSFKKEKKISRAMIETVMYNSQQYNLSDPRMRVFLALHYLTLNDVYERKKMG